MFRVMGTVRNIELFFQEGSSDKVYNAQIVETGGKHTVNVQWGRRGAHLNEGAKAVNVSRVEADKVFDRLVREKRGKGYEELTTGHQPAAVAPPEGSGSGSKVGGKRAKVGHAAQLLEPLDDGELTGFLANDDMIAQQKLDGVRVLVHVGEELIVTNRDGKKTQHGGGALDGLAYLPHGTVIDGELLGDHYWLFDVLELAGEDVRERGYLERWQLLDSEARAGATTGGVKILPARDRQEGQGQAPRQAPRGRGRGDRVQGPRSAVRERPERDAAQAQVREVGRRGARRERRQRVCRMVRVRRQVIVRRSVACSRARPTHRARSSTRDSDAARRSCARCATCTPPTITSCSSRCSSTSAATRPRSSASATSCCRRIAA